MIPRQRKLKPEYIPANGWVERLILILVYVGKLITQFVFLMNNHLSIKSYYLNTDQTTIHDESSVQLKEIS